MFPEVQSSLTTVSKNTCIKPVKKQLQCGNAQIKDSPYLKEEENNSETPTSLSDRLLFWRTTATIRRGINSKCHSQPTLPVYPDSVEHFCGPELMSDQRYIHWRHLLPSPTHGLAINAVKLASGFHGENTAHEVDLGLSNGVQNGVLKWNKYPALTDQAFF